MFAEPNAAPLWGLPSLPLRSFNKRVCVLLCSPKLPYRATSHTRNTLSEIGGVWLMKNVNKETALMEINHIINRG